MGGPLVYLAEHPDGHREGEESACLSVGGNFLKFKKYYKVLVSLFLWAASSFGRAPVLHTGGEEFESPAVHQDRDFK